MHNTDGPIGSAGGTPKVCMRKASLNSVVTLYIGSFTHPGPTTGQMSVQMLSLCVAILMHFNHATHPVRSTLDLVLPQSFCSTCGRLLRLHYKLFPISVTPFKIVRWASEIRSAIGGSGRQPR